MYNVCTIMYTHIRSQASDWNCCVKRLFVCTTVHIPYVILRTLCGETEIVELKKQLKGTYTVTQRD